MLKRCPHCDRVLQKTVSPACSWCGAELPDGLKPDADLIQRLREEEVAADRREKEIERIEKETRQNANNRAIRWFGRFRGR